MTLKDKLSHWNLSFWVDSLYIPFVETIITGREHSRFFKYLLCPKLYNNMIITSLLSVGVVALNNFSKGVP